MKRLLDILLSSFALLLLWPVFIAIAIAVKTETRGPVFFKQTRVGRDGRDFLMYKFRKFPLEHETGGPGVTVANDSRMTKTGKLLERLKLDELPQFINVLRGEMSIVGPRPETPNFVTHYSPDDHRVLSVRPGIFGVNQLIYRREAALYPPGVDPDDFYVKELMPKKLRNDLEYIKSASVLKDFAILLRCVGEVLLEPVVSRFRKGKGSHV